MAIVVVQQKPIFASIVVLLVFVANFHVFADDYCQNDEKAVGTVFSKIDSLLLNFFHPHNLFTLIFNFLACKNACPGLRDTWAERYVILTN